MTTRELTESIEEVVVHQRLEETQPNQIQIPGYSDWNPWGASLKSKFLEELERRGRIHRAVHPGSRTPGGYRIGPAPK